MREISKRESICKNRFSVLQSTGKQFEKDINAFLQLIKAKEDGMAEANGSGLPGSQSGLSQSIALTQQQSQSAGNGVNNSQKSRSLGYNRFDQERYTAKDETGGFSIDTKLTYQPNGGTISLTSNTNTSDSSSQFNKPLNNNNISQLSQQKSNIVNSSSSTQLNSSNKSKYQSSQSPQQQPQRRTHSKPIIIIPAAPTSSITMLNALDILQELRYLF